jgi:23S rRNA pseudouridine2605 synthase
MNDHKNHRNGPKGSGQAARPAPPTAAPEGERVAKALARAGVASRREIERLIEAGRVALNGQVLTTPAVKVGPSDILTVDGAPVEAAEPARLFLYHKPPGLVTTHADPKGRPTVFQALPRGLPRLISVGRLDLNSEGLLLLTNDGGLSRALELPSTGLARCYRARARGRITQARLDALKDGIVVEGVQYGAIDATLDKAKEGPAGANLWITLTLTEGKNREVRRVLEALGLSVNRLIRVAYGPFALGALERGAVEEVGPRALREQLGHLIAPGHQPKGDRPLYRPEPPAAQAPTRRPQGTAIGRAYSPKPPREKPRPARGAATEKPTSGRGEATRQGQKSFASRSPTPDGKSTKAGPPRERAAGPRPTGPKGYGPKASGARPAGARPSGARPSGATPSGVKPHRPGAGRKGPAK